MHLISIKNNELIKRVAVASLAALMTIPSLTINSYATDALSMAQNRLKNYEQQLKNYESYGNTKMVEKTKERIAQTKNEIEKAKQNNEIKAQKAAQAQAIQAEKDRIANTVYPLTAKYVKDFVPAVDDYQPHFYERADLPGVIFTLRKDQFGKIHDENPHFEIVEMPDQHRESVLNGNTEKKFDNVLQVIKVNYTSPFNFAGKPYAAINGFNVNSDLNGCYLMGGWCHHIGKNRDVIMDHIVAEYYKSGWPEYYLGKSVKEITKENADPQYGWFTDDSSFRRLSMDEIIKKGIRYDYILSTDEKTNVTDASMRDYVNNYYGSDFDEYDSIYEVAGRYGTDYTDEERQTLVIKPTPVNQYTNAGSEPIVDEQEWIDANINYDRNPQSLSDEEWWK